MKSFARGTMLTMDLLAELPDLMSLAIGWAKTLSQHGQELGHPLAPELIAVARQVGVADPQRIRLQIVDALPMPVEPRLRAVAEEAGLLSSSMVGLTLGYSVFIVEGHGDIRLLSHEFRHVFQYEQFGSIERFLPVYLDQVARFGYEGAPLEQDARSREVKSDG